MDPDFCSTPASPAYFDPQRGAWILSRYADLRAALRDRALFLSSARGDTFPDGEDEKARSLQFARVKSEIAQVHAGLWRAEMESLAESVLRRTTSGQPLDLIGEIAHPWSVGLLMSLSEAPSALRPQISEVAACLLYKKAFGLNPDGPTKPPLLRADRNLKALGAESEARLDSLLQNKKVAISKSTFMAVSQTLPAFLGKAWLALLRNTDQMELLRATPALMPHAVAELLRYAGIVHTLYRKAVGTIEVGHIRIEKGAQVQLKIASANFDPEEFEDPNDLDVTRQHHGQFSLGAGLHACLGANLVREAFAATAPIFLAARPVPVADQRVVWMGDSTLRWPLAVWARLDNHRPTAFSRVSPDRATLNA